MDSTELKDEFEILFEDLATSGSKGLDIYEKSVCYTYAQEQLVRQLMKEDLYAISGLIKTKLEPTGTQSEYKTGKNYPLSPSEIGILGYYASSVKKDIPATEVPQQVIDKLLLAPYQYPPKNLVYVVVGEDTNVVFLPLNFVPTGFTTRYVAYPPPIILGTLQGVTINGLSTESPPSITEDYHRTLVEAAVQYAIKVYIGQPEKEVPAK
jgi:hypothetical protein